MTSKTQYEMSADSRAIFDRLKACKVGDVVSYDEIDKIARRNVRGRDRYVLVSAIKAALREGLVFDAVRGVGVKLLNDVEIVSTAEGVIPRIRRLSRRATRKLTSVRDFNGLPNDHKVKHNATLSMLGAVSMFARGESVSKVEGEVRKANQTLSLGATLELFRGK